MDMIGKETLEKILLEFEGSILFVSHDRYFIKQLAQSLIVFEDSEARHIDLTYEQYLEKRAQGEPNDQKITRQATPREQTSAKASYNASKEKSRLERRIVKINEEIERTELLVTEKKSEMNECGSDYVRLCALTDEVDAMEERLFELLEELEECEATLKSMQK
jgi:ATP-binding cassette subfamily F protein 3